MSSHSQPTTARPVTVPMIRAAKSSKRKLVMLTAYDAPTTRWVEAAGADMILVGDSVAMVVLGHRTTLEVTLDEMLHHTRAVSRTAAHCLVVGDLPFGSYQASLEATLNAGIQMIKEGGAHAVKLEGLWPDRIRALVRAQIPVMGHVGLTPQSYHSFGGFRVQASQMEAAERLLEHALELQEAGCFAIVLEAIPAEVAEVVTARLRIPTIGIGAGPSCDGQVLVIHDLLGMTPPPLPRFVLRTAEIEAVASSGVRDFIEAVQDGSFPSAEQCYHLKPKPLERWRELTSTKD